MQRLFKSLRYQRKLLLLGIGLYSGLI